MVRTLWSAPTVRARLARAALLPLSAAYGAATALRRWGYDRAWLPMYDPAIPAIAVGNLTVGGTGKTPVAAWVAAELRRREAPTRRSCCAAIAAAMRPVHEILNPDHSGSHRRGPARRGRARARDGL